MSMPLMRNFGWQRMIDQNDIETGCLHICKVPILPMKSLYVP
jgi:hypothetical protein